MKKTKNHKGQVALVMVLIMTVVSAVVVSVAGRATNETKIQQLSKESSDAFLAAQAGLEDALSKKSSVGITNVENGSYLVNLENKGQEGVLTEKMGSGSSMDIVLAASPLLQGVKVYWKSATGTSSAIVVSKYTSGTISETAYDSLGANGFTRVSAGGVLSGVNFTYVTPTITVDTSTTRIRITVLGQPTFLGIEPIGDNLPVQVVSYKSEANIGTGLEKIKYGLEYEESKDARTPEVFDYALFSFGTLIQ